MTWAFSKSSSSNTHCEWPSPLTCGSTPITTAHFTNTNQSKNIITYSNTNTVTDLHLSHVEVPIRLTSAHIPNWDFWKMKPSKSKMRALFPKTGGEALCKHLQIVYRFLKQQLLPCCTAEPNPIKLTFVYNLEWCYFCLFYLHDI